MFGDTCRKVTLITRFLWVFLWSLEKLISMIFWNVFVSHIRPMLECEQPAVFLITKGESLILECVQWRAWWLEWRVWRTQRDLFNWTCSHSAFESSVETISKTAWYCMVNLVRNYRDTFRQYLNPQNVGIGGNNLSRWDWGLILVWLCFPEWRTYGMLYQLKLSSLQQKLSSN